MKRASATMLALLMATAAPLALAQGAPPPTGSPPMGAGGPDGPPPAMPAMADTHYDTAITIRDGALIGPVGDDVRGTPTAALVDHVAISSGVDGRNGVIVSGKASATTLDHAVIRMTGTGKNDFLGIGAGVMVRDHAQLTIDHANIETNGPVSSAVVAAEGATLHISNSRLVANGGKLPADYKPHIGPGMMEPPAPLGLSGTARTLLAMSNSHTIVDHSSIEADGWGALSTDATGGDLYLEANDCTVKVTHAGYGTYADFGAHVVLNRTAVDSGGYVGIIAGKARIDLNKVAGHAGFSAVMIHSVMGDPQEVATLNITDSAISTKGPVLLVKSANAAISITGGSFVSDAGVLLLVRKNDDSHATQTHGAKVPGVHLTISGARLTGDIDDSDTDRTTYLDLASASLNGALHHVVLRADAASHWTARADSQIALAAGTPVAVIDAPAGVTITASAGVDGAPHGRYPLSGGGVLLVTD